MPIIKLLFGFKGRINRSQYWLVAGVTCVGLLIGIAVSISMFASKLGKTSFQSLSSAEQLSSLGTMLLPILIGLCVTIWMTAAAYTKRLHDRNKSAIWLLAIFGPSILVPVFPPLVFLSAIAGIWVFVELGCLLGTDGPNRFDEGPSHAYLDDAFGKKPINSGPQSFGGMEAAMAAVTAAARAAPAPVKQSAYLAGTTGSPQFSGGAPNGFGGKPVVTGGGAFGRRGV